MIEDNELTQVPRQTLPLMLESLRNPMYLVEMLLGEENASEVRKANSKTPFLFPSTTCK